MKVLPIGTVVILKGANKKLMIIGYFPEDNKSKKKYDYVACLFPEGLMSSDSFYMFNKEKIQQVFHEGYKE